MANNNKILRIALIGPESTGKTTLCKLLAEHYNTVWVPEYAREHIEKLNRPYTLDDIIISAKQQLKIEEEMLHHSNKFFFADTEMIVAKIWCEDVFGTCPVWIEKMIEEKKYDAYLLTSPDIPWQLDPVRENPHRRNYFFCLYLQEIVKRQFTYKIISGTGNVRLQNAINALETIIK